MIRLCIYKLQAVGLVLAFVLVSAIPVAAAPPLQQEQIYVVQVGDTLSAIALRFGVTVEALMVANQMDDADLIYEGQQITIPAPSSQAEPSVTTSSQMYIVQAGDTLSAIARRFGVTVESLIQANDLSDPDYLRVGQQLIIPEATPSTSYPAPFVAISLAPLPAIQGQTLVVRVELAEPATLSGEFDDRPIYFVSGQKSGWGLVGIHAMQPDGKYSLTVRARLGTGKEVVATVPMTVSEGPFATENVELAPDRANLLDPKVSAAEDAHLKEVWSQVSPRPLWEGVFRLPLASERITSFFGTRRSYNGGPVSGYHTGTDLGASEGTPIYAPAAGRVVLAEQLVVRGNTILIDHGLGVFSGYFHQSKMVVEPGQLVKAGDLIGYVGNTGLSNGAHLHWEMRVAGIAVDAIQWTQMTLP
jgi:murein DD-endopeptidase MepM/ murein hydrolase activator NlpD